MKNQTKNLIGDTTKLLMETKPISEITVSEICLACTIQRPTFYYYFKDKYDVIGWLFTQIADKSDLTSLDESAQILKRMRAEFSFYQHAYDDYSQNNLLSSMRKYFITRYIQIISNKIAPRPLTEQLKFDIKFQVYGASSLTRDWFLNPHDISAKEFATRLWRAEPQSLKAFFKDPTIEK